MNVAVVQRRSVQARKTTLARGFAQCVSVFQWPRDSVAGARAGARVVVVPGVCTGFRKVESILPRRDPCRGAFLSLLYYKVTSIAPQ